jgi:hypothetical protein
VLALIIWNFGFSGAVGALASFFDSEANKTQIQLLMQIWGFNFCLVAIFGHKVQCYYLYGYDGGFNRDKMSISVKGLPAAGEKELAEGTEARNKISGPKNTSPTNNEELTPGEALKKAESLNAEYAALNMQLKNQLAEYEFNAQRVQEGLAPLSHEEYETIRIKKLREVRGAKKTQSRGGTAPAIQSSSGAGSPTDPSLIHTNRRSSRVSVAPISEEKDK